MRGLTAVPAPDGDGEVLLGSRAQPGVIERIDPRAEYAVTVELDIREHFAKAWNLPNYQTRRSLGLQHDDTVDQSEKR